MDTSSTRILDYSLQYQWFSDSDLSSISSSETLSPVHSMDSSLSPSYLRPPQSGAKTSLDSSPYSPPSRGRRAGRAQRIRSKQRESASEKEKLRMRDLTKALHHLRSYLPPSVAPAGQTLTKIETLRLTIRYISHLSAQLGLGPEAPEALEAPEGPERWDTSASYPSSPDVSGFFQSAVTAAAAGPQENLSHVYPAHCYSQDALLHSGSCSLGADPFSRRYGDAPRGDDGVGSCLQSPPASRPSCQMCGKDFCVPLVPREYWG